VSRTLNDRPVALIRTSAYRPPAMDTDAPSMSNRAMNPLDVLFRHLDQWRHLPAYQLERRIDIFFSVYLKGVVEERIGVPLEDDIIPELPIRRDLIWPEHATFQSVKVDYALFAKDRSRVFFVELKTDGASRRPAQDNYLEAARRLGFRPIVEGIHSIMRRSDASSKYNHLAALLARLGYFTFPPETGKRPRQRLRDIAVAPVESEVEVLYVEPNATGASSIDFEHFAAYVARLSDPISRTFSEHLLKWRDVAGERPPAP
jgi:hypothetical protein